MKTTISKTFDFDAAHRLEKLPPEHKCHRLHGHTYRVEVILEGNPNASELKMFIDYAEIATAWQPIHDALDHRCLNDITEIGHPTTEALAEWIYWKLNDSAIGAFLAKVRVYESSTTWCEVSQ